MGDEEARTADAQTRIAEVEELYRSAPVGLCLLDTDLRFVRINERLAAINGRSVEEHLGRTVNEVIPELAAEVVPRYRKVLETGHATENVEVSGVLPSRPHDPRTWLVSDHPVKTQLGKVTGVITVVKDVTALKRHEQELRTVRARLAEAERVAHLGCWEWNLIRGELWWSDELHRMVGRDPRGFRPTFEDFVEHVVPKDRARVRSQLDAVYAGENLDTRFRITALDGTERVMHSRARLTRNEEGEPHVLFGTAQDVTQEELTREAFERELGGLEAERARLERLLEERTRELDRAIDTRRRSG